MVIYLDFEVNLLNIANHFWLRKKLRRKTYLIDNLTNELNYNVRNVTGSPKSSLTFSS